MTAETKRIMGRNRLVIVAAVTVLLAAVAGSVTWSGGPEAAARSGPDRVASTAALSPGARVISVSIPDGRLLPGGEALLQVAVANGGDAALENVEVRLKSSSTRVAPRIGSFRIARIEPGQTVLRTVRVEADLKARGKVWLTAGTAGVFDSVRLTIVDPGPCLNPATAARLLCPDLKIAKPSEMYVDFRTRPGRVLLRSTNDIQSRGSGPMELRGRRDRPRTMAVIQAIVRRAGGYALYPVQARLGFHNVGAEYGGSYWKVRSPLRFELWRLDARGEPTKRVRVGPKQFYCFRDLVRTDPGPRSPATFVYPSCNQNPTQREVTLGTSVGWSDVYPSTYDQQWIDVTGLRGCFSYLLRVDPLGLLYESRETNNVSQRKVRLPFRGGGAGGCQ